VNRSRAAGGAFPGAGIVMSEVKSARWFQSARAEKQKPGRGGWNDTTNFASQPRRRKTISQEIGECL